MAVSGDRWGWRGRSGSSHTGHRHRIARADRRADGLERWVIAPAALADRRRLLGRCRSLC
eukprot:2262903-Prymnesium_polylepis.1